MPRLTDQQYLERRRLILREWFGRDGNGFGYLSPEDQHALHDYFGTLKNLDAKGALAFRRQIPASRPSLPHKAGRAFLELTSALEYYANLPPTPPATGPKRSRQVKLYALVQPEIDVKQLVRVLVMLSKDPAARALIEKSASRVK